MKTPMPVLVKKGCPKSSGFFWNTVFAGWKIWRIWMVLPFQISRDLTQSMADLCKALKLFGDYPSVAILYPTILRRHRSPMTCVLVYEFWGPSGDLLWHLQKMFKRRLGSPPHPGCQSSPGWHEPFLGAGIPTETFLCHRRSNACESKVLLLGMVIPPLIRESLLLTFNSEVLTNWVYTNVYGNWVDFPIPPKKSKISPTHGTYPKPRTNSFWRNFFLCGGERGSLGVSSQCYVGKIIEKNNGTIMEVELHGTHMGVSLNGGTPKTPQNDHF